MPDADRRAGVEGGVLRRVAPFAITAAMTVSCARCEPAPPSVVGADAAIEAGAPGADLDDAGGAVLDGARVRAAYERLAAGDEAAARAAFRALGPPRLPPARLGDVFAPAGGARALLALGAMCDFGDVGVARCAAIQERGGGTCREGRLTTGCGQVLVDLADGRVRAFFEPGAARGVGRYLVTRAADDTSVVKPMDRPGDLLTVKGDVVGALDGSGKLVAVAAGAEPNVADVRVLDAEAGSISPPCRIRRNGAPSPQTMRFRFLEGAKRLVVEEGRPSAEVTLCAVDTGRALAAFTVRGNTVTAVDPGEKTLYVSGGLAGAETEHAAVDLATGNVQRVRTRERPSELPGREVTLDADGATFVVATNDRLRFFSTHPFRALPEIALGMHTSDSSDERAPALTALPDGKTVLAVDRALAVTDAPGAIDDDGTTAPSHDVWVVSTASRRVLRRGRGGGGWSSDGSGTRGAVVIVSAGGERVVVSSTRAGLATRLLAPGEGVAAGERVPPEMAGLAPVLPSRSAPPVPPPGLADKLCAFGALPVPRALCAAAP